MRLVERAFIRAKSKKGEVICRGFSLRHCILFAFIIISSFNSFSANEVKETRLWPAPDYTRITIESSAKINNDQMMLKEP